MSEAFVTVAVFVVFLVMAMIIAFYIEDVKGLFKRKPKPKPHEIRENGQYKYCYSLFENAKPPFNEDQLIRANNIMLKMEKGQIKDFEGFDWIDRLTYIKTRKQNQKDYLKVVK